MTGSERGARGVPGACTAHRQPLRVSAHLVGLEGTSDHTAPHWSVRVGEGSGRVHNNNGFCWTALSCPICLLYMSSFVRGGGGGCGDGHPSEHYPGSIVLSV